MYELTREAGTSTHQAFPVGGSSEQACTRPEPGPLLQPAPFTPWANPRTLQMNGAPGVVQLAGPFRMYAEKHLRFLITLGKCPDKI